MMYKYIKMEDKENLEIIIEINFFLKSNLIKKFFKNQLLK